MRLVEGYQDWVRWVAAALNRSGFEAKHVVEQHLWLADLCLVEPGVVKYIELISEQRSALDE